MVELPTVEEILKVRCIPPAFQEAWEKSFIDKAHCCEQGGYIYADLNGDNPKTKLVVVPVGRDKTKTDSQRNPTGNLSIDLNNPHTENNWILVANFHTHPLHPIVKGNAYPSKADKENAWFRQVPGIVISREGIVKYGVRNRTDMRNRSKGGYPPEPPGPMQYLSEELILNTRPKTARWQWEPDASVQWFNGEEVQNDVEGVLEDKNGDDEDGN